MGSVQSELNRPVFLIGMPRSGTTLIFESFARCAGLGWFSYRFARFPRFPAISATARLCDVSPYFRKAVTRSDQRVSWFERLRDGPSEAFSVWEEYCGKKFSLDYLLSLDATPQERAAMRNVISRVLYWQGTSRFAAKVTGPARVRYIKSIFDDAHFVHIVRDGRAVVNSLLRVDFWRNTFRMHEPAWHGGLKPEYLRIWEEHDRDPLMLAALQWRNVIERTEEERQRYSPRVFIEARYEDFLADPIGEMNRICQSTGTTFSESARNWLTRSKAVRPSAVGPDQYFTREEIARLDDLLGDVLERYGYMATA
jgi:hypothetical protein